jgi:enterochelin esterase-like enzyme
MSASGSRIVTEMLPYDGGRRVSVSLPSGTPTAIVGVHGLSDERERLDEYSPVFDADRFSAHENFFVTDVPNWVRETFNIDLTAERTAVFGASAGGELSIALGLRHPDLYGAILSGSPGAGYQPPESIGGPIPRTYLVAGTQEPFFLQNAARWACALQDAGGELVFTQRDANHGPALWREEFPLIINWACA